MTDDPPPITPKEWEERNEARIREMEERERERIRTKGTSLDKWWYRQGIQREKEERKR